MAHELQARYASLVDAKVRKVLVTKDNYIFNTYFEGVPTAGSVKLPIRDGETEVGDYSTTNISGNTIKYGSTKYLTAVIDNDKYINEYIDNYEAAAVPDSLVADRLDSASYSLANTIDTNALQTLAYAMEGKDKSGVAFGASDPRNAKTGISAGALALTKSNVYETLVKVAQKLDEADVPAEGRFAIVTPAVRALLLQDSNFIRQADLSQELVESGAIGQVAGLTIYVSNKLAGLTATKAFQIIAGCPQWATRIAEWKIEPGLYDLNGDANVIGGSAVKGRYIFTHEITKPQTFAFVTVA